MILKGNHVLFETVTRDEVFEHFKGHKQPWYYARSHFQKRARSKYKKSVKPKHCKVCGYYKSYQVAHIQGAMTFSGDTTIGVINALDNLVALCPNHHTEYDDETMDAADLELLKGPTWAPRKI